MDSEFPHARTRRQAKLAHPEQVSEPEQIILLLLVM
jgi:hypothetical protein